MKCKPAGTWGAESWQTGPFPYGSATTFLDLMIGFYYASDCVQHGGDPNPLELHVAFFDNITNCNPFYMAGNVTLGDAGCTTGNSNIITIEVTA